MVTEASVFGVGLGSAGVADGGANDAGQAAEHRFGSPEAAEGEDGDMQAVLVSRVEGGLGDPIREPDAESIVDEYEDDQH